MTLTAPVYPGAGRDTERGWVTRKIRRPHDALNHCNLLTHLETWGSAKEHIFRCLLALLYGIHPNWGKPGNVKSMSDQVRFQRERTSDEISISSTNIHYCVTKQMKEMLTTRGTKSRHKSYTNTFLNTAICYISQRFKFLKEGLSNFHFHFELIIFKQNK